MTGETKAVMNLDPLDKKLEAFDWDVINIEDGNDMLQVCQALDKLPKSDPNIRRKPIFIIANTDKGKGVGFMEGSYKWHGGGIANCPPYTVAKHGIIGLTRVSKINLREINPEILFAK